MEKIIEEHLGKSVELKTKILNDLSLLTMIKKVSLAIIEAYRNRKKLILFGNGGSAADAQHIAAELVNKFELERMALPAIALTTDTSILTSIANDYDYSRIFARQVEALAEEGDVVMGISTSGTSPSVIKGIGVAREKGAKTIGLTGKNGGKLAKIVDLVLKVPSNDTPRIQEAHITILHIICYLIEKKLFS